MNKIKLPKKIKALCENGYERERLGKNLYQTYVHATDMLIGQLASDETENLDKFLSTYSSAIQASYHQIALYNPLDLDEVLDLKNHLMRTLIDNKVIKDSDICPCCLLKRAKYLEAYGTDQELWSFIKEQFYYNPERSMYELIELDEVA